MHPKGGNVIQLERAQNLGIPYVNTTYAHFAHDLRTLQLYAAKGCSKSNTTVWESSV